MKFRVAVGLIIPALMVGCGDGGQGTQMNPGTVADGADAAKAGLQGTSGNDMKKTMATASKAAPSAGSNQKAK